MPTATRVARNLDGARTMLTSSEKRDYILRMIAQLRQLAEALVGKVRQNEDSAEVRAQAREALAALLGPMSDVVQRLDSASAAQMVNDPDVLAAWAHVVAAEADAHRASGDAATAGALSRRALELALEAHQRTLADVPELLALIARLRTAADGPVPPPSAAV
jgi:HPt (histidine-containing phosphotransfer) domain-containing protein